MSLIHSELILVQGEMHGYSFSFQFSACRYPVFPATLVEDCLLAIICFWHISQKLGGHSCVDSYPGLLFCSTGLHIHAVFIVTAL
jgi:hypothetical protein